MKADIDLTRFEELAMTHGPDLDAWPDAARPGAKALAAESAEARAIIEDAAALFAALDAEAGAPAPVPEALMSRVLADAAAEAPRPADPPKPARRPFAGLGEILRWATPSAALAASLALGLAIGYSAPESWSDTAFATQSDGILTETVPLASDPGLYDDDTGNDASGNGAVL